MSPSGWQTGAITEKAVAEPSMHVIERTDRFTPIGAVACASSSRSSPRRARASLRHRYRHAARERRRRADGRARRGPTVIEQPARLRSTTTSTTSRCVRRSRRDRRVGAARSRRRRRGRASARRGRRGVRRVPRGEAAEPERPLLHHVAVLADRRRSTATRRCAWGSRWTTSWTRRTRSQCSCSDRTGRVEYVEHKPTFSLV